ncbi:MAG TPA: hypothetical protein VM146_03870 [Steroidobacteraceae bacterium]|nr:hypothetical protein [Steroidobacteraceae bacterium]
MLPAFDNWRAAARFSALLLVLLALPIINVGLGLPSRAEVYNGLRLAGGPYVKTRQQMFGTTGDIDVAFLGSSILNVAINGDEVQRSFAAKFGPDVNVRMMGFVFQGYDMQYVMARDLLEHRRVKMLVISFSGPRAIRDRPHVQLHNLLRWGEYPEMVAGRPLQERAAIYASSVLDGPRQLLKRLRPERPIDAADDNRSLMVFDPPAARFDTPAPPIELTDGTRDEFTFGDPEITARQKHYATLISQLAAEHHVKLVVLNIPTPEEFGEAKIWERTDWRPLLAGDSAVVAFRRADLFGAEPASRFFKDSVHMTAEGQERFTRSFIPYLMSRYEELQDQ